MIWKLSNQNTSYSRPIWVVHSFKNEEKKTNNSRLIWVFCGGEKAKSDDMCEYQMCKP